MAAGPSSKWLSATSRDGPLRLRDNLKCLSLFLCSPREHDVLPVPRPHEHPHHYTRSSQARITCQLEIFSRARPHLHPPEIRVPHSAYPNPWLFESVYPPHSHYLPNSTTTTMAPTSFASAAAGSNASSARAETSADWYVLLFLSFCTLHAHTHHPSSRAVEYHSKLCNYTPYFFHICYTIRFHHGQ